MKKYWLSGALLLLLLLTLSGCFFREPEDLYQSPEQSADYLSLTQTIRNVKDSLAQEYGVEVEDVSVMSGDNTALIQLQDLDRDGERETAVTFFRVSEAEKPLKIYFFTRTAEDTYTVSAMVEGNGTAIYRVDYVDLNGSGCKEVVVSWQMSTGVYLLGAYSLEEAMVRSLQYAASAPAGSIVKTSAADIAKLSMRFFMYLGPSFLKFFFFLDSAAKSHSSSPCNRFVWLCIPFSFSQTFA